MVRLLDRRSFLAAGATAGVVTIAGCGQDSGAPETENTEAGTDEPGTTCEESNDGSASFDLDITADQLPDAFESISVEFTGFELSDVDGCTVTRESDPVQFDLDQVEAGFDWSEGSIDLMETDVPPGEYDSITYFITVTDTTLSSGDGEQTFQTNEDGRVPGILWDSGGNSLRIEAGESITITPQLTVQEGFSYDWRMGSKFDTQESLDRQS
ncbi:hypothetical protein EGH22_15810 [Halomicroarcula sp. F28]|uniref:hypothetical protein n=1 Tax=Haloarcula salinisoli TaxID=2487746 RepID=UPI001C73D7BB|nr:hypothetical protein [Halomicroarcula salinisoli]MBX0287802.1 hypothetical protein [Halomicroarcula salinisoli]